MSKGKLICFSGIDASGKSSCIEILLNYLASQGIDKIITTDGQKPSKYNKILRDKSLGLGEDMFEIYGGLVQLSFACDLIEVYNTIVEPHINAGYYVIMHRNDLCCKAYSMLRDAEGKASTIIDRMLSFYPKADIHFYLDVDANVAFERVKQRFREQKIRPSINENPYYLRLVQNNYEHLISTQYNHIIRVNANRNLQHIIRDIYGFVATIM